MLPGMATDKPPMPLRELIAALRRLDRLKGVERAKLARELGGTHGPAIATISAAGDEGVWQATRGSTYEQVATAIGYGPNSKSKIADAVSAHNAALRAAKVDRSAEDEASE